MVPAGSSITFQIQGVTSVSVPWFGDAPATIHNAVINGLTPYFTVYTVQVVAPSLLQMIAQNDLINFPYSGTVQIRTRAAYGSIDDVGSIVAHAFADATGAVPTVTAPAFGQPAQMPAIGTSGTSVTDLVTNFGTGLENAIAGAGKGVGSLLGDGLKPFLNLLQNAEYLVIGGIVIIVALVVFSPTGREAGKGFKVLL